MSIKQLLHYVSVSGGNLDIDYVDQLQTVVTSNVLIAMASLTAAKNFLGSALQCTSNTGMPSSWNRYAENLCWSESTYFVQPDVHVATIKDTERYSPDRKLSYYQWVPFFLLFSAACFRLPSFLWKCLSINSGLRIHEIVSRALDPVNMEEATRQRNIDILSKHISNALRFQRRIHRRNIIIHKTFKFLNVAYSACFISYMYLVTKALYVINVVAQLYLMNKFLETDKYQWYGFAVIRDLIHGRDWESSGFFPRVSICDFTVRQVANIQKYSVQCVLVINIFNEKIFILLWFWYTILLAVTVVSFLYWMFVMAFPCFGRWYVATSLELNDSENIDVSKHRKDIRKFVNEYLKQDGIFVLRMVSMHAGILFGTELTMNLYKVFIGIQNSSQKIPQVTENHYVNNKDHYIRRRKKRKELDLGSDKIITALLPQALSDHSRSSSKSSSSSSKGNKKSDDAKSDVV